MNYYKRHLGDYARDAGHLSLVEHGAFTVLLDRYYATEKPLQVDDAIRVCRARTQADKEIVTAILREFFHETPEGWANKRADEEIAAYNEKASRNREIGRHGGRPKTQTVNSGNPDGFQNETERVTKNNPSHKPLATSHKEEDTPVVPKGTAALDAVLDAYHSTLPKCKAISVLNPKRRKRIAAAEKLAKQVCAEQGWPYEPAEFWKSYFGECSNDPWMRGEVANPKNPAWRQNLDVLIAEDRFAGIMDSAITSMRGQP